jgi:hypothetical protein
VDKKKSERGNKKNYLVSADQQTYDTFILIIHLLCTTLYNVFKEPLIVGLAIFSCASFEFEFNLSKKVNAKICMEGRMIMIMMIACIEMVAVGVCGVCPAKSI